MVQTLLFLKIRILPVHRTTHSLHIFVAGCINSYSVVIHHQDTENIFGLIDKTTTKFPQRQPQEINSNRICIKLTYGTAAGAVHGTGKIEHDRSYADSDMKGVMFH